MKYKEIENLLRSKKDIEFKTLRNITFTCFNPEMQILHLSNLKRYFTNLEYSEILNFVDYLKQNTEIKNCLDGLDLPTKFIALKKKNGLAYGCYVRNGAEYTRRLVDFLAGKRNMADVIAAYDFFIELY